MNKQLDKLKLPKEAQGKVAALTTSMDKISVPSFDTEIVDKVGLSNINPGMPDVPGLAIPNTNRSGSLYRRNSSERVI